MSGIEELAAEIDRLREQCEIGAAELLEMQTRAEAAEAERDGPTCSRLRAADALAAAAGAG